MSKLADKVVIMFGADEPYLNTGLAENRHQLISGSQLQTIADAWHYVQADQLEAIAACIQQALKNFQPSHM